MDDKIMMNKVTFVGFNGRGAIPPLDSPLFYSLAYCFSVGLLRNKFQVPKFLFSNP